MRGRFSALLATLMLVPAVASAHRIDEYLQATLLTLEPQTLSGSMRLVPGMLVASDVIAGIDVNGDGVFSPEEQQTYAEQALHSISITLDGRTIQPTLTAWSFPSAEEMRDGLGEITITYRAALSDTIGNHALILANRSLLKEPVYLINIVAPEDKSLRILAQKRNQEQSVYEVDYVYKTAMLEEHPATDLSLHTWLEGVQFPSLFQLGMRHIAEGTDHLLFLLTLLLPAPLVAANRRWGLPLPAARSVLNILKVVTAFTLGHSLTLMVAAMNWIRVSSRLIEVLIAFSILVSAVNALRPILPGREAWIALFFGLIHGLAFAATLDRLGVSHWYRVAGILSFNLGIEAMQMIVVAAILPSLLLLSRTQAYSTFRIVGSGFAAVAALGWMLERLFYLRLPVDSFISALARHAIWIATSLLLLSLLCRMSLPDRSRQRTNLAALSESPTV